MRAIRALQGHQSFRWRYSGYRKMRFYDKGQIILPLRPEGTAPVVRSMWKTKLFAPEVQKTKQVLITWAQ